MNWVSKIEEFFTMAYVPEEKQVRFVAYKLKGGAATWWDQLQSTRRRQGKSSVRSWRRMKQLLQDNFFPQGFHQLSRFENCLQGNRFVTTYTDEFNQISSRYGVPMSVKPAATVSRPTSSASVDRPSAPAYATSVDQPANRSVTQQSTFMSAIPTATLATEAEIEPTINRQPADELAMTRATGSDPSLDSPRQPQPPVQPQQEIKETSTIAVEEDTTEGDGMEEQGEFEERENAKTSNGVAQFIEDHTATSYSSGVQAITKSRVPFQRKKLDLSIYNFRDHDSKGQHEDKLERTSSLEGYKATYELNSRSSSSEEREEFFQHIFQYDPNRKELVFKGDRHDDLQHWNHSNPHVYFLDSDEMNSRTSSCEERGKDHTGSFGSFEEGENDEPATTIAKTTSTLATTSSIAKIEMHKHTTGSILGQASIRFGPSGRRILQGLMDPSVQRKELRSLGEVKRSMQEILGTIDRGHILFDPGGASPSICFITRFHGQVPFDPGGAQSGGYFISNKVFEAFIFNNRESKISSGCQRRIGKQRSWDHTYLERGVHP
jgi:hypothetical protein